MHYKVLFPSLYLGSHDFKGDAVFTITRLQVETLKTTGGDEKKPVLFFEETRARAQQNGEKEKRLVLNKTNAATIAAMYGPEVDNWAGKKITLFPSRCEAFGKMVDCLRVRPGAPQVTQGGKDVDVGNEEVFSTPDDDAALSQHDREVEQSRVDA